MRAILLALALAMPLGHVDNDTTTTSPATLTE